MSGEQSREEDLRAGSLFLRVTAESHTQFIVLCSFAGQREAATLLPYLHGADHP